MTRTSTLIGAAIVGASLAGGIASVAAQSAGAPAAPSADGRVDPDMMRGGMMPMMQEMSKMMETCNKMMQTMMDRQPSGGPGQQPQDKRG